MHKAALHGSLSIVDSLLGGDLTSSETLARAADRDGRTPMHYAARGRDSDARSDIMQTIEHAGGDREMEDNVCTVMYSTVQ